jgi:gamma-glutamylcyclotransferase (GGCT)/AIG2-like uncharacterized protein YtfP
MADKRSLVFVYGSLRADYWNHEYLEGSPFMGSGKTVENFDLWVHLWSAIPVAVPNPGGVPLIGEVYEVDQPTLDGLNTLEIGYQSKTFRIKLRDGFLAEALIYYVDWPKDAPYAAGGLKLIPSGDYVDALPDK